MNENECLSCGGELTDYEIDYYDGRCEDCEADWLLRIKAWRNGAEDAQLDSFFATTDFKTQTTAIILH